MSMRLRSMRWMLLVATALVLAPRDAAADWVVTPFLAWNLGGEGHVDAGVARENTSKSFGASGCYGVSVAARVSRVLAIEFDVARSPHAFEHSDVGSAVRFTRDSHVSTITGNLIVGAHNRPLQPYAAVGFGVLRTTLQDLRDTVPTTHNDLGVDLGAGLLASVATHVGIRGDVRYFRSFRSRDMDFTGLALATLQFWRASAGVSLSF